MRGAGTSLIRLIEPALVVAAILAAAWVSWANALGDRTIAMVVGLSATCAAVVAVMGGRAWLAAGVSPAIAFATVRTLSTPIMGVTDMFGIGTRRGPMEALLIGGGLAALSAALAAFAARRVSVRRTGGAVLTWAPAVIVALALGMALVESWTHPSPDGYAASQPVLAHMEPERSGGWVVVDEIERTDGLTLVRVCEQEPSCHTLLRRGNQVTSRLGHVDRDAVIHLRFDPNHLLYLVESQDQVVLTVHSETLASYAVLFPTQVRRSLSPPLPYQLLAVLGVAAVLLIALLRRRVARRAARIESATAGVCFGDGWALLPDGTALCVASDLERGPILVSGPAVWQGLREDMQALMAGERRRLDALQQALLWTLGIPLIIAAAMV